MSDLYERLRDALASAPDGCWDFEPCCYSALDALLPVVKQEIERGQRDPAAKVEALIPGFERDYGIQSSPVSRLRALLADIQKGEE